MAYEKGIDLNIIYQVLPEYDPISKSDNELIPKKLYKCIDTKTGDIYLRPHPKFGYSKKFVMSYADAKKELLKNNKNKENIEW